MGGGGGEGEDIGIRDINPKTLRWYTRAHITKVLHKKLSPILYNVILNLVT